MKLAFFGLIGLTLCSTVVAQYSPKQNKPVAIKADARLERVVATVGERKITRRDVMLAYAESDPRVLGSFLLERYPTLQSEMQVSLADLSDQMFTKFPNSLETLVQELMASAAIEQAAKQKGVTVTEAEISAFVHDSLDVRRKSAELPEMSDAELIRKFNDRISKLRSTARRKLLTDRLIVADMENKLGRKLTPNDFYRLKMIYVEAPVKDNGRDYEAAKAKAELAHKEIVGGQKSFEQAAKEYSTDGSRLHDANIGVLPRTYLKIEIENALIKMKPGEMTAPIQAGNGYGIFRLEANGTMLTEEDRRKSLQFVCNVPKKISDALSWALRDVRWTTTIGKPPEWIRQGVASN